jgi:hypothetical protein
VVERAARQDLIQVGCYKLTRKRVFKMAPLQHHFELAGWTETTIVVRFWLIADVFVALGLWIFLHGRGRGPSRRRGARDMRMRPCCCWPGR